MRKTRGTFTSVGARGGHAACRSLPKTLTVAWMALLGASGCKQAAPTVDAGLQYARDVQQVQNLMSRRAFYHSIGHNESELELWATQHEVRWAQNQGCYVGMASLKVYYDDINRQMQAASLEKLSKANPAIKNVPENRGVGTFVFHTLTTPVIEIAQDGQSAKGMWYTPGVALAPNDDSKPAGFWMWERYGVDFIKEDGQWRILHIQTNTDFMTPMGSPLQLPDQAAAMGTEGAAGTAAPAPGPGADNIKIPPPDIPKPTYQDYSLTRVPTITPRMPEPYKTLSETFQYATCE